MSITLIFFFLTTFSVVIFRFATSTLNIQQSFSLSLLLNAIFGRIILANYSLNFYLHCLTSKLFQPEFLKCIPCIISISLRQTRVAPSLQVNTTATQRPFNHQQTETIGQLLRNIVIRTPCKIHA